MQKRKYQKHSSLLLILLISGVFFTGISICEKNTIYQDYDINLRTEPMFTVLFQGMKDGVYPWDGLFRSPGNSGDTSYVMASGSVEYDAEDDLEAKSDSENVTEQAKQESPDSKQESPGSQQTVMNNETDQSEAAAKDKTTKEPEKNADDTQDDEKDKNTEEKSDTESVLKLAKVDQSYFDDALFIGDSRTEGLSEYSYLNNATFYADAGLSVYTIFTRKICKVGKKMLTIEDALKKKEFKKIYVMLGVNELGTGNSKTFKDKYQEVIQKIEDLQPNAYIVIEGIMNVGKELSESHAYFNNKNIAHRNAKIRKLADDKKIFYVDINKVITDEDGYLPKDITFDDVHLKAKYYDIWADYLMDHGIVEEKKEE